MTITLPAETSLAEPWVLIALIAVAALIPLRWWWRLRIRLAQRGIGTLSPHLQAAHHRWRARVGRALVTAGLLFGLLAFAQPRGPIAESDLRAGRGADIVVVLDCSRSMLADDVYPDRMAVARRKVLDLLNRAPDHRMALMPFAGRHLLRAPFTGDAQAIKELLQDCSPELFPAEAGLQGTAIAASVEAAIELVRRSNQRGGCILVVSDGVDTTKRAASGEDPIMAAAQQARDEGVPVFGLFLGEPERDTPVTIDGRAVVMQADMTSLATLAERSGGVAVSLASDASDIDLLQNEIQDRVPSSPWEEQQRVQASERYHWALWPAVILLAAGSLLPSARRRTPPAEDVA